MTESKSVIFKLGMALVKPEFLKHDHKLEVSKEFLSKEVKEKFENQNKRKLEDDEEGNGENNGSSAKKKMKLTGRNKHRPVGFKANNADKLCPAILHEQECKYGDKCKFSHDVEKFMSNKPADLGPDCINFQKYGICRYGIACRYASKHISEDFKNITNEELCAEMKKKKIVTNSLDRDIQVKLWKKKYDFEKANKNSSRIKREVKAKLDGPYNSNLNQFQSKGWQNQGQSYFEMQATSGNGQKNDQTPELNLDQQPTDTLSSYSQNDSTEISTSEPPSGESSQGAEMKGDNPETFGQDIEAYTTKQSHITKSHLDSEGIRLRPQEKKLIDFSKKLYLAPLTTVGNLPFRRICKTYGADITCGEMAIATNILQGQMSEWALLKRHESEDIFGVQICGAWPDTLTRCCDLINRELDVDFVDLNCGCPIDLVFKKGEGCALMGKTNKFEQVIRSMKSVLDVPLTVKMRTGIYDDKRIAHFLTPKLRDWGASLVTLHGRSREQRYTRDADWEYINEVAKLGSPMPVFGNGDVLSYEDWNNHLENTGVSGCMIARGALIKPWIFCEIKEQRHWDISAGERLDMLKTFVNNGLEHWGSDQQGVENTRRFLLEWLSFLYRYIPVGVLERMPQKINERPPFYVGRSDLETLMSSSNCGDWIKISEMLLGPVPDGFNFLPKHKANAYK